MRLTADSPAYYMTLGAYMCIAKTFITRTPYTYVAQDLEACQRYWWQNLLCEYDTWSSCFMRPGRIHHK